jgi:hypothetical protein
LIHRPVVHASVPAAANRAFDRSKAVREKARAKRAQNLTIGTDTHHASEGREIRNANAARRSLQYRSAHRSGVKAPFGLNFPLFVLFPLPVVELTLGILFDVTCQSDNLWMNELFDPWLAAPAGSLATELSAARPAALVVCAHDILIKVY